MDGTRTQGELNFIDQMTRKMMVTWCDRQLMGMPLPGITYETVPTPPPYMAHAIEKGWVSKDGTRVLSAGWATATAFLRR
jgi:hypothetical protein